MGTSQIFTFLPRFLIRLYQTARTGSFRCCRFYPTCSEYSYQALEQHGLWQGTAETLRRLLKCHPWHPGGYDPIS